MGRIGQLRIGTSGYQYRHWRGDFYPDGLPTRLWFAHYAQQFDAVEINATFYGLPPEATFDRWRQQAPPGFRFALKLGRQVTHWKRLLEPAAYLTEFFALAERLGPALGPVLVQLPPRWRADPPRLDAFLRQLPRGVRVAVEFRDASWLCDGVFDVLRTNAAALVVHDRIDAHPFVRTADWTYLRFHGIGYDGSYGSGALRDEALRIRAWLDEGLDVHAYFNNDLGGHAPRNAADLRRLVLARP